MGKLFGTDGIRGKANQSPLDCETAVKVGRAVGAYFGRSQNAPKILIGQDTRISCDMIAGALSSGICSTGVDVHLTGVLPTPGVARLTAVGDFCAGVVISASHNPFYDNGIKLFRKDGFKLSDDMEKEVEALILNEQSVDNAAGIIQKTGKIMRYTDADDQYLAFLGNITKPSFSLKGMKIAIDCSNGASSHLAARLFNGFGAQVHRLSDQPDGLNINDNCGSQYPEYLSDIVVQTDSDIGLAFDGDADRLIAVDEKGGILTGDQVIAICAMDLRKKNKLKNNRVVTTVMSNIGLGMALASQGIEHQVSDVGDRYVMEKMMACDAVLGGEDSGHMIFLDHHTTGDGMLAALHLLEAITDSGRPLSELANIMTVFPQSLINVDVQSKPEISRVSAVTDAIKKAESSLGEKGRVLVRYSGTQPKCRVMVEGPSKDITHGLCRKIAAVVANKLG